MILIKFEYLEKILRDFFGVIFTFGFVNDFDGDFVNCICIWLCWWLWMAILLFIARDFDAYDFENDLIMDFVYD